MLSFGLHIHVGVKNEDVAIYVMNEMLRWTYPLLALSANSPYYECEETGLASTRAHLFHSMPRSRYAPHFKKYSEYVHFYEKLLEVGDVTRTGDLWWVIRPQPSLGTVEFRIFDLPTSVNRIGAFAALLQAAVAVYQDRFLAGEPLTFIHHGFLEQNWWRAMRYGLGSKMIEPETGEITTMKDQLHRLLEFVAPKAKELNAEKHINYAKTMIEQGNEAEMQKALCKRLKGDLRILELVLAEKTVDFSVDIPKGISAAYAVPPQLKTLPKVRVKV